MKSLNILIIGAGMYVCGRGTDEYGTIMPAVLEWTKENNLGDVYVAATGPKSVRVAKRKINQLQRKMDVAVSLTYFPQGKRQDEECYKEALKRIPKPAVCIVAVPDNLHKDIAATAMKEGLHTLVVKPLAPTTKEVYELIDIQKKKNVYCAVEFHKRFDYANLKLKDTIEQGVIGELLYFVAEFSQRKSMPTKIFKKWVETTNVFQYLGIHYVDIIYFVTGAVPERVMAIGQKGWLLSRGINTYDSIQGIIEWKMPSGKRFSSYILTNWIDPESTSAISDQKIKVIGTKGRLESDQKSRGITIVTDKKGVEEPNPYFCSAYGPVGKISYRGYGIDSIRQFLNDVFKIEEGTLRIGDLEGKRPTFKDSIVPTQVLEAVNKTLRDGGTWVDIKKRHKI